MNEDAAEWAAVCIVVVWLWCLLVVVPAFLAGRWRRVGAAVHVTGVVALILFNLFWFSLLGDDSNAAGFVVAPLAVAGLVLWTVRRYAWAALAFWSAAAVLVATGFAYMVFYGPAPIGVVSGAMAATRASRSTSTSPASEH